MLTKLFVALLTFAWMSALAGDAVAREPGAFEKHLRDAIRLNQERRPLYAARSGGASTRVSDHLIRDERVALPVAMVIDRLARSYQAHGVPIVAEDFIGMDRAPSFAPSAPDPQPLSAFVRQDGLAIAKRIRDAGKLKGFDGVCRAIQAELDRLASVPTYHAMVRHVLLSALRSASLAPKHDALARSKGLPSTVKLSRRLIGLNLLALLGAVALDVDAAGVQAKGIPILHRDVPLIDAHSDFYDGPRSPAGH